MIIARGAALTDTRRELRVRAELAPGSAARDLVKHGALDPDARGEPGNSARLGEEAGAPVGHVLPVPVDGGDGEE